jgi:HEAT repeat protein
VKQLIAALKNNDKNGRLAVAYALVMIGVLAVEPLIIALKDKVVDVCLAAVIALGRIRHARAIESLINALKDKWSNFRQAAADALIMIGTPAVKSLIATLGYISLSVCHAAAEALGTIGDPRAVEPLISALGEKQFKSHLSAAKVLIIFYQSDILSEQQKQLVLENRTLITTNHTEHNKQTIITVPRISPTTRIQPRALIRGLASLFPFNLCESGLAYMQLLVSQE